MTVTKARDFDSPIGGKQNGFEPDITVGNAMFVKVIESSQDLRQDAICFHGWDRSVAGQEGAEIPSCAVWHDETELRTLIVEYVEDGENIGVIGVDGCRLRRAWGLIQDGVSVHLDSE